MKEETVIQAVRQVLAKRAFWGPWMPVSLREEAEDTLRKAVGAAKAQELKGRIILETAVLYNRTVQPEKTVLLKSEMQGLEDVEPCVKADFQWQLALAMGPIAYHIAPHLPDWEKAIGHAKAALEILEKAQPKPNIRTIREKITALSDLVEGKGDLGDEATARKLGLKFLTE